MVSIRIKVPQEVAEGIRARVISQRELVELITDHYFQQIASAQGIVDTFPAANGATRTQEKWIPYFNQKRKRMISAPDVYRIVQNGTPNLIQSVRNDFEEDWLVTSTRETYIPNTLDARITHNYGSTVVRPTEKTVLVPVYQGTPLDEVLKEKKGVAYLRVKLGTNDAPKKIRETLTALSGKPANLTSIWTPDQENRLSYQERAALFVFVFDGFRVGGDYCIVDRGGHSRGVSMESTKPTRKK